MTFLLQVRDVDLITKKHHINPNWGTLYEIFDFKHIWAMKVKKKKKKDLRTVSDQRKIKRNTINASCGYGRNLLLLKTGQCEQGLTALIHGFSLTTLMR